MSVEMLHAARKQLQTAQEQLIRDYTAAGKEWPKATAIAAQCALFQAHNALVPLAYTLGEKFGRQFCEAWDVATPLPVRLGRSAHQASAPVRPA